jgi:O-antigen ligase
VRFDAGQWIPEELEAEDYLLLSAVFLLPWAFGGVEMWAYRSAATLLAFAAAWSLYKHGLGGVGLDRGSRWLLPAALLAALALLQIVPLPPALLRVASPQAEAVHRTAYPGYPSAPADVAASWEKRALDLVPEARDVPAPAGPADSFRPAVPGRWSGWRTLSLEVDATVERLFWYLALLLGFLVAARRSWEAEVRERYRKVLFVLFGSLAVCGLLQAMTWNGKLLWVRSFHAAAHPFGPYVNPNHFGGAMELAVPWLAGWGWHRIRSTPGNPWRETPAPIALGTSLLCFLAGAVAGSRMATVLMTLALTVLAVIGVRRAKVRKLAALGVVLLLVAGAAVVVRTPLGERFQSLLSGAEGVSGNERALAWKASLAMLRDFPVFGTGFGTFRFVFPSYVPAGEISTWLQVHNDYLEVLLEGGVVAGFLLLWLVAAYSRRVLADGPTSLAANSSRLGMLLGLLSLAIHAFVEFNHQIPANALLFVVVAALALPAGKGRVPREASS